MSNGGSHAASQRFLATLAYLGPLVIVPLFVRRRQRFLRYHTRQGVYVFLVFVAAFLLTIIPLYLLRDVASADVAFNVLAVVFLMEFVVWGMGTLYLAVQAFRGLMPMVPILGELSGEV